MFKTKQNVKRNSIHLRETWTLQDDLLRQEHARGREPGNKKTHPRLLARPHCSLGDIAIYTTEEEVPLGKVLEAIRGKFEAKPIDMAQYKTNDQLGEFFKEILPNFDEERVYKTDIKKMMQWYNLLVNAGITDFAKKEEEHQQENKEEKGA